MKRELSPSDVIIGQVNKKNRVLSLPSTVQPLMAYVKVEDVVAENVRGSGAEMSSVGGNMYE